MNRFDVLDLIVAGEGSGVEFKAERTEPLRLAKELVALANHSGGTLLLGVADDATVVGLDGTAEEWVMNVARSRIRPPIIPWYQDVEVQPGRRVGVVRVERGLVHSVWHDGHHRYYIRVGSTSREASPEELARLFQQRGAVRAELQPITGTSLADLDLRRLQEYFAERAQEAPQADDAAGWERLLVNLEILRETEQSDRPAASIAGLLLFGMVPARHLAHATIDASAYPEAEKTYETIDHERLAGPLVPLGPASVRIDPGLVERALAFVSRTTSHGVKILPSGERIDRAALPLEAVREVVVNAVVHRDYLLAASDIELAVYPDRLEVISPGRLPNGVTPEGMRLGVRAARNQLLKDTLRDYGLLEHRGLGIPRIVIRAMREHNGTDPDLVELTDERFLVRLWTKPPGTSPAL